jgi:hypothetical protein
MHPGHSEVAASHLGGHLMFARSLIAIFCLGGFVVSGRSEEPAKDKPIDPETVAAYAKVRGKYRGRLPRL